MKPIYFYFFLSSCLISCKQGGPYHSKLNTQIFEEGKQVGVLSSNSMKEASGLDASYNNPGMYWTHNDSGNGANLYLIDQKGTLRLTVKLRGLDNQDWEDITLMKTDNRSFIYVGDIGDNMGKRKNLRIYKFAEPTLGDVPEIEIAKEEVEIMNFTYENGSRDAETLFAYTPEQKLIVVSKRETECFIYPFVFKASKHVQVIKPEGRVPITGLTAGDMSERGEILMKNYEEVFYWQPSDTPLITRLTKGPDFRIPYITEPQGEAICWDNSGNFLTVSESHPWSRQYIYFYKRSR